MYSIQLTIAFGVNSWGSTRATLNGISYLHQKVPTLFSVLSAPSNSIASDPAVYGHATNAFVLPHNSVVELTIVNQDARAHPMHIHGHHVQVVARGEDVNAAGRFPGLYELPATPMRRDTVVVYGSGSVTVRFRADNPGVQLVHCHTEWHVESGMTATLIEAPTELRRRMGGAGWKDKLPGSHVDVCRTGDIKMEGNAAGNTRDWRNLTGQITESDEDYWGALIVDD